MKIKVRLRPQTTHKAKIQPFTNETRSIEVDKSKPFMPAIIQVLQIKGVQSDGNIAKLADDIAQIKTIKDINPNDIFKVNKQEVVLIYELIPDIYTGVSGKDIPYRGWSITNYVDVQGFDYLSMINGSTSYSCYYDADKMPLGTMISQTYDKVPERAKYVRISNESSALSKLEIKGGKFVVVNK
ncbi:hypothetical protein [Aggregatibacter segnis]|jgi:hypothetical protein|uniref:hypothetical protein n=1 Tax=Aggregatibacter segnis TaxID=739 RepID=UPI000D654852|nr:hypothetical protein [Aggregatibacter segnis]DAY01116.1 MAG TPA: hypothetical protein [Caudoviricetes sp.]